MLPGMMTIRSIRGMLRCSTFFPKLDVKIAIHFPITVLARCVDHRIVATEASIPVDQVPHCLEVFVLSVDRNLNRIVVWRERVVLVASRDA